MSKCEGCQKYEDCSTGSGLTWPCGAYVPRAQTLENIHTYPEMNETVKDLLRRSGEPMNLYILARIEELESVNAGLLEAWREVCEACGFNDDCQWEDCAGYKWRPSWKEGTAPRTHFDRIRASKIPEQMVVELNANGRRFCPKEYSRKEPTCTVPCGRCIATWLREEAQT